jgi:cytoskeletal protein CcmA (bactofilin family)
MIIRGQVRSGEHIQVDGELEGGLQLPGYDLMVGAQGRVRADVAAREVEIAGIIDGNVDATKKVTVRKGGRLLGDLRTPGIVIEDGAYFKGKIEIVNSETQASANEPGQSPKTAVANV